MKVLYVLLACLFGLVGASNLQSTESPPLTPTKKPKVIKQLLTY